MSSEPIGGAGLAGRYAAALFDLADAGKELDSVSNDLLSLDEMIDGSDDLKRLLQSPEISRDDQGRAIGAIGESLPRLAERLLRPEACLWMPSGGCGDSLRPLALLGLHADGCDAAALWRAARAGGWAVRNVTLISPGSHLPASMGNFSLDEANPDQEGGAHGLARR